MIAYLKWWWRRLWVRRGEMYLIVAGDRCEVRKGSMWDTPAIAEHVRRMRSKSI